MIGWIIAIILATAIGFFAGLLFGFAAMIKHLIGDKKPLLWSGKIYRAIEEVSE